MKEVVSIPASALNLSEELAARLGSSRSKLYFRALRELLEEPDAATITAQLDAVHGGPKVDAGPDPALATMQWHSIQSERQS